MNRGTWWSIVHGITKSRIWLRIHIALHSGKTWRQPLYCELFPWSSRLGSVQFSHSVVSDSLWPHESQHARLPSITNSWILPKPMSIESVMPSNHHILCRPLLLLPSIFPSIRVFSNESALCIRWPKYWSSVSTSVLPVNTQDWSPLGWTGWISLQSKGLSRVYSNTTVQKYQFFGAQYPF